MFSTPPTTTRTGRMAYAESRCPNSCLSPPPPRAHHRNSDNIIAVKASHRQRLSLQVVHRVALTYLGATFSNSQASPGSSCPTTAHKVLSFGMLLPSLHINTPEFLLRPFQRHTFSRAFAGGFCRSVPGKNLRTGPVSLNPNPVLSSWVATEKPALQNGIEMDR